MARKAVAKTSSPPTKNARKPHSTIEPTNEGNEPMVPSKAKGKKTVTMDGGSRQSKGKRKAVDILVESVDRDSRMDGFDEEQSNSDQLEAEARRENATGKAHSKKKVTFVEPTKAHSNKKVTFVEPTPTKAYSKKVTFVEPKKAHRSVTFPLPEDLLSDDELKQKYPDVRLRKWMTTKRNLELVSRLHANMAQELEVAVAREGTQDSIFVTGFNALGKSLDEFIAIHMVVPPSLDDKDVRGSKAAVADKQRIAETITKRYTRAAFKKGVAVDGAGTATVDGGAAKPTVKK